MAEAVAELIAPTRERLAHAGDLVEVPEVSQARQARAYRVVGLVYSLHARGMIDDRAYAAFVRFEGDWSIANRSPAAVARYSDAAAGGGDFDDAVEIRKSNAWRRCQKALGAIGSAHAQRALLMAVSARPADATTTVRPYTLEEIGRACSPYASKIHAVTAANVVLRDVLYQLHLHYDEG